MDRARRRVCSAHLISIRLLNATRRTGEGTRLKRLSYIIYWFVCALSWAQDPRCSSVLIEVDGETYVVSPRSEPKEESSAYLWPELVSDSPETTRAFFEKLANPRLASALEHHHGIRARGSFNFAPFNEAFRKEIEGLETGMAFSLLRRNFEGQSFADQEEQIVSLWSKPEVLYFSPGHGLPGAQMSVQGSPSAVKGDEVAFIRLRLNVNVIETSVAATKAAEKAEAAFYASCNAGLSDTFDGVFAPAAGETLARRLRKPVVAPNGALIQMVTTREPLLVYLSVSQTQADGSKIVLHEDKAFTLFEADGTAKPITFAEAMQTVSRREAKSQYINSWNPVSEAN